MPEVTDPSVPSAPTGQLGAAAWFLRFFSGMTADRALVLFMLCAVCWLGWTGREDAITQHQEHVETIRDLRRDGESREEKYREHNLSTIKLCNQACTELDKTRRQESTSQHKENQAILTDIRNELKKKPFVIP